MRIQRDMLPTIFPPFPERPDFDIYASMIPAKEVGGDFYDYFLIDDDHLCLVKSAGCRFGAIVGYSIIVELRTVE